MFTIMSPNSRFLTIALLAAALTTTLSAQTFKVIHTFVGGNDGSYPNGTLLIDSSGNLFGVTEFGGNGFCNGCGTVYELTLNHRTWTKTTLHNFRGWDGSTPWGALVFGPDGNIYGVTARGGKGRVGAVYQLSYVNGVWKETTVYAFGRYAFEPNGGLVFDSSGNLYGTTIFGGYADCYGKTCGTVFELTPTQSGYWKESRIVKFMRSQGTFPGAGLAIDSNGDLYGTTAVGGACNGGTVFQVSGSGNTWTEKTLESLGCQAGGQLPVAKPVLSSSGALYGTSWGGGKFKGGVAFQLTNSNGQWTLTVLHRFGQGKDGAKLGSEVVFDSAGNIYGTTQGGGAFGKGTVYKISPAGNGTYKERILHSFTGGKDGDTPSGGLVMDSAGHMYGVTMQGGSTGVGVAFQITP